MFSYGTTRLKKKKSRKKKPCKKWGFYTLEQFRKFMCMSIVNWFGKEYNHKEERRLSLIRKKGEYDGFVFKSLVN